MMEYYVFVLENVNNFHMKVIDCCVFTYYVHLFIFFFKKLNKLYEINNINK